MNDVLYVLKVYITQILTSVSLNEVKIAEFTK